MITKSTDFLTESCNNKFFKFTEETAKLLRDANLSKNARTLWDYIVTTNPFGDEEITAPQILTELNWQVHTYYRAKKELEVAGLVKVKKHQCTLISTLKTRVTRAVERVTKTVKGFDKNSKSIYKNCKSIEENCQNESPKALSIKDSGLSQTNQINSDLSDQSEELTKSKIKIDDGLIKRKDDGLINEKENNGLINEREDDGLINEREDDGLINNKLIDQEIKKENTIISSRPVPLEDEKLNNEEFIRYAQGKLPKARDIKRYLLTKDKTTGDQILERLWLEYQQGQTGKSNNPNSTGSEYFDNLIEEYKKTKPWEDFNWDSVNWEKLPCYDLWLNKATNCKRDYTFIDDNGLGFNRNLRTIFFRWYEQEGNRERGTGNSNQEIPDNPQAVGLINVFKQIMRGGVNYAY